MPIVIKSQGGDNTHDLIKRFKKAVAISDIVQKSKDGRYFVKPSQQRKVKKIEMNRLRKRSRSLKKMKNISAVTIQRINDRLGSRG